MIEVSQRNFGEVVVFRGASRTRIWYALPVTVVQDSPDLIALYWPAGTRGKWRMKASREKVTPGDVMGKPMELIDHTWNQTDVLMLITPGAAHAVYVMLQAGTQNLVCWYINLQDPIRRMPIGFDTCDHVLDLVVSHDKSAWHWKDEDQLEEAVAVGMFTQQEARDIRAEGERVVRLIHENQPPFCDGWEKWIPPACWSIPALPDGWDVGYKK
jgi:hypothetical protein